MDSENPKKNNLLKRFSVSSSQNKIFIAVIVFALIAGIGTGYSLASSGTTKSTNKLISTNETPQAPQQDTQTFKDFEVGKIQKKPEPKKGQDYSEGTHYLIRDNGKVPVALTSSVVDLSQYEGKNVKVYGETQKALKEGWLMDIGKVEVK